MLRGGLVKRAGSHHDGVCRCPEEPHNETVRFVESADIASPRFAGDFVTDHTVNRAHEVADHEGPFGAGWREPQIAAVSNSQFLRQNGRLGSFPALDQRADDFWQGPLLGRRASLRRSSGGRYGNRKSPDRPVDVAIASVFAAASTTSPLGIHYYAIAFSGRCACTAQHADCGSPLVSAGHL